MRRMGICEERGSGVDKIVSQTEAYQLPAPLFEVPDASTRAVLFANRPLSEMDRSERLRACYQHACLRYVLHQPMTNASLSASASRRRTRPSPRASSVTRWRRGWSSWKMRPPPRASAGISRGGHAAGRPGMEAADSTPPGRFLRSCAPLGI